MKAMDADVVIIGAGAAGIAAARKMRAARRRFILLEATDRVGGRCITDTTQMSLPCDLGAHYIHMPEINPLVNLGLNLGYDIYPAPGAPRLRLPLEGAETNPHKEFDAALTRANAAIAEASRRTLDVSCAEALPPDLLDWRQTVEFVLGPFLCGKDLANVSAKDFSNSAEKEIDAYCRQGYGAIIKGLAEGLSVRFNTPATLVDMRCSRYVEVTTAKGPLRAKGAIVTASTGVLAAGGINFVPSLPNPHQEAIARLTLGSYDRVGLELKRKLPGLSSDDLVFAKSSNACSAALLANVSGSQLSLIDVGGDFGRDLVNGGKKEMITFAIDWLAHLIGSKVKRTVRSAFTTCWNKDPWVMGAFSSAPPGYSHLRRALGIPVEGFLCFAGEAVHETLWGTVGGAWEFGERAAVTIIDALPRV